VRRRAVALALAASLASGCAHQITVEPAVLDAAGQLPGTTRPLLVVEGVQVIENAYPFAGNEGFVNRLVMELRRTRSFENVLPPAASADAPAHAVRVHVDAVEWVREHWGPNIGKAIAIGMSLFLLTPVLPIQVGYEVELRASATTCDGWIRLIRSAANGELRYRVFLSNEYKGRNELVGAVTERALHNLVAQIASDQALRERVASLAREGDCQKEVLAP
jgi:hypothetical protein